MCSYKTKQHLRPSIANKLPLLIIFLWNKKWLDFKASLKWITKNHSKFKFFHVGFQTLHDLPSTPTSSLTLSKSLCLASIDESHASFQGCACTSAHKHAHSQVNPQFTELLLSLLLQNLYTYRPLPGPCLHSHLTSHLLTCTPLIIPDSAKGSSLTPSSFSLF